jgi:acyl carrier protein
MNRETVQQRLNTIFQDVFDNPAIEVNDSMTAPDVEGWDSLTHVNLIVAVEKEFKIRMTTAEVLGLNNVGDFITLIARKSSG